MKRMLFNATQAEELRVAIVDGQKLIDLDIESAAKEQRKSNIYKGIVTRVEPSLEACFVDYGADRHGFLPFKEISRSYFQPGVDVARSKVNEAIKEGQELIVQVDKDERGNKGAALTTFISLAGRHLVLMPNNPRGGGVSRRVDGDERAELREAMDQLIVPQGMSLIARTAAIGRQVEELQWDLNYLQQLWKAIEGAAHEHKAPLLIYQEGSLVIRAIRDYFQPEIGEILIDTDDIFEQAQAFMGQVMPGNVQRVKRYRDDVPLFSRFQIEHQIETAFAREVRLPSGGAIVIDHTEALVAVDVNSGRATKGADIEETALKTNLEAADEIGRQLRLRDLGGLIVIDFIDMEPQRNQREVENRLKDALRFDRARVQMGKISRFGLMELSRQRLRPALAETSYIPCPRCTGTGHIRSTESAALHILRILEEEAMKDNTGAVHVQMPVDVATFLLNEKRHDIQAIELRHKVGILLIPNIHLETPAHTITRLRHEDLNQEELREPSYKMVELLPVEEAGRPGQNNAAGEKPRQEAAIKHIAPSQPAPAPAGLKQSDKPGFLRRLFSGLFGSKETENSEQSKSPRPPRENNRDTRDGRRERPGRQGRNGRNRSEERPDSARGERSNRPERTDNKRPQVETSEAANNDTLREQRPPRERAPRNEQRPERSERRERSTEDRGSLQTGPNASETPLDDNGPSSGRRRGRRGGRNRGDRPESGTAISENNAFSETEQAPSIAPISGVTFSPEPGLVSEERTPVSQPAPVAETPLMAQAEEREEISLAFSVAQPVTTVVLTPEAAPMVITVAPPVAAPPVTPPPSSPAPAISLENALASTGLVMVDTVAAPTAAPEPTPVAPIGRPRRPKATAKTPEAEPMVMVETQAPGA